MIFAFLKFRNVLLSAQVLGTPAPGWVKASHFTALRSLDSDERIARKDREIANISHRIGFKTK